MKNSSISGYYFPRKLPHKTLLFRFFTPIFCRELTIFRQKLPPFNQYLSIYTQKMPLLTQKMPPFTTPNTRL